MQIYKFSIILHLRERLASEITTYRQWRSTEYTSEFLKSPATNIIKYCEWDCDQALFCVVCARAIYYMHARSHIMGYR